MRKRPLPVLLAALLASSLGARSVHAEESDSSLVLAPIFVKGPDAIRNVTDPVVARLRQMGESPSVLRDSTTVCPDVACGKTLIADSAGGRLLGGAMQIEGARISGSLYWLDVRSGKSVARQFFCESCDPGEQMAHHLALLVEQAPGAMPVDCSAQVSASAPPDFVKNALSQGVDLAIRVQGGAKVDTSTVRSTVQQALLQLGIPSVSADRAAGVETENTSRTSLSIDLVSDKRRRGAVDVVALSLRGKGDERSVRFYCPSRSCQKHLPVQLAVNLAMLFDSAAPPQLASVSADCLLPLRKPIEVAGLQVLPLPGDDKGNPGKPITDPPLPPVVTSPPPPAHCPLSTGQKVLRYGGAALLGLGAAGIVTGGVFQSQNGVEYTCTFDGGSAPCRWNTRTATSISFGLGGGGLILGGLLLGLSYLPNNASTCGVGK
ncbi:MAG TPA: hypothetical protein PKO07_25770 [Pseudomonadota bacterium]|nr:hypothetical protein [Pseudomonadota bacterium]